MLLWSLVPLKLALRPSRHTWRGRWLCPWALVGHHVQQQDHRSLGGVCLQHPQHVRITSEIFIVVRALLAAGSSRAGEQRRRGRDCRGFRRTCRLLYVRSARRRFRTAGRGEKHGVITSILHYPLSIAQGGLSRLSKNKQKKTYFMGVSIRATHDLSRLHVCVRMPNGGCFCSPSLRRTRAG